MATTIGKEDWAMSDSLLVFILWETHDHELTVPSHAILIFFAVMNIEKLQKMAGTVRTGGKGTVRRKKKAVHKASSTDDKRLQNTLKRLGVNTIPGIEEVLLFNEDSTVLVFSNPKVQASIAANTYVVSGPSQMKSGQDLVASMLGGNASLQQLMAQMQGMQGLPGMSSGAGAGAEAGAGDDDDDVPELVGNFEQAA